MVHKPLLTLRRRGRWTLSVAAALGIAGLVASVPSHQAGATSETFFATSAPCVLAHCNQHLDGREGGSNELSIPVGHTPSSYYTYTPSSAIAFDKGLACSAGLPGSGSTPNVVECTGRKPSGAGSSQGPFVLNLTASGGGSTTSLSTQWTSANWTGSQTLPCTRGSEWAMDQHVIAGAPLFSDLGYTYLSDDLSMAKYNPTGDQNGIGTCAWGVSNPAGTAMISWNALQLPANGSYSGGWYLIGQGSEGPVLLVDFAGASTITQLSLPDGSGGDYATYNTISVVDNISSGSFKGARIYVSTADCASSGCSDPLAQLPGALYAIDVLSPSTSGGTPTMQVAWSYSFYGPSGASPVLIPAEDNGGTSPVGDQVYFDGAGTSCCTEHPTLFALKDNCTFGTTSCTGSLSPTLLFSIDFTGSGFVTADNGYCPDNDTDDTYQGIQAAAALEPPESSGSDLHYSVWVHVACSPNLYRFDANTGARWSGNGASSINISNLSGLNGYVAGSTMQTVINSTTGDQVAFLGANVSPASFDSYVVALDLETGSLLWKVDGPSTVSHKDDTPFHGQFPIAETSCGTGCTNYILVAATAGATDGAQILGIPLS